MTDNEEIKGKPEEEYVDPRKGKIMPQNHKSNCRICQGGDRVDIERKFLNWESSVKQLAVEFNLPERDIHRHIRYFHLREKRALKAMPLLDSLLDLSYEALDPGKIKPADILAMLKMKKEIQQDIDGTPEENITEEISKMDTPELRDTLRKLNINIEGLSDKE